MGWEALWVPIAWVAKLRFGGDKLTPGCPYAGREAAVMVITKTNSNRRDVVCMNSSRRAFLGIGCSGTVRDTCIPQGFAKPASLEQTVLTATSRPDLDGIG
jgi:hypothetical protein